MADPVTTTKAVIGVVGIALKLYDMLTKKAAPKPDLSGINLKLDDILWFQSEVQAEVQQINVALGQLLENIEGSASIAGLRGRTIDADTALSTAAAIAQQASGGTLSDAQTRSFEALVNESQALAFGFAAELRHFPPRKEYWLEGIEYAFGGLTLMQRLVPTFVMIERSVGVDAPASSGFLDLYQNIRAQTQVALDLIVGFGEHQIVYHEEREKQLQAAVLSNPIFSGWRTHLDRLTQPLHEGSLLDLSVNTRFIAARALGACRPPHASDQLADVLPLTKEEGRGGWDLRAAEVPAKLNAQAVYGEGVLVGLSSIALLIGDVRTGRLAKFSETYPKYMPWILNGVAGASFELPLASKRYTCMDGTVFGPSDSRFDEIAAEGRRDLPRLLQTFVDTCVGETEQRWKGLVVERLRQECTAMSEDIGAVIPARIDQNPCAQARWPMERMRHGWSMRSFHAAQQWATMSS